MIKTTKTTLKDARNAKLREDLIAYMKNRIAFLRSELDAKKARLEVLLTEMENDNHLHVEERRELEYSIIPKLQKEIKAKENDSRAH
ncbi:MAG: hypothetical protein KGN01_07695 [Patescibacteria group bacterium]|nr:hypothetical protein [Patescibacteria group bacterium]